jgi:hypothetical protein
MEVMLRRGPAAYAGTLIGGVSHTRGEPVMSSTIAHRQHVQHRHVPLMPIFAVFVTIVLATAVIWAVNQPQSTTITTTTEAVGAPLVQPAAVAAPESPVFRHAQMRAAINGGSPRVYVVNLHHLVNGATLDRVTTDPGAVLTGQRHPLPVR